MAEDSSCAFAASTAMDFALITGYDVNLVRPPQHLTAHIKGGCRCCAKTAVEKLYGIKGALAAGKNLNEIQHHILAAAEECLNGQEGASRS